MRKHQHPYRSLARKLLALTTLVVLALPGAGEAAAAPADPASGARLRPSASAEATRAAPASRCRSRRTTAARRACRRRTVVRPVRGGTLVVALSSDPGQLNPAITTSGAVHPAAEPMYNGLVSLDENGNPVPELARGWRIEDGGRRYTFFLRRGVRWHDGRLFTSADVKYTYEEALLKLHARTRASMGSVIDGIDAPNPYTVVFRFKRPYAPLLQQMDVTEGPILPRHIFEGTDPNTNPANNAPVGTGPYRFVSYEKGAEVVLARNPRYFRSALPYLDRMVLRVIPDASTRLVALEAGEVDWIPGVPVPASDRTRLNSSLTLQRTPWNPGGSNCVMTVSYNLDRPALQDVRVRRALGYGLDRQQFVDQILFGEGGVAIAPISSGIGFAHATDVNIPGFSPELADQLLNEAGWKLENNVRVARGVNGVADGTRMSFDFVQRPSDTKYGEIIRQRLGALGIEVKLQTLEDITFRPTIFKDRNFDMNIISYCHGTDPQIGVRRMFHSSQIGPTDFTNSSGYSNPEVDAKLDLAAQLVNRDDARRVYRELQEKLVEDMPYMWLVETVSTRAHTTKCTGFRYRSGLFAEAAYCRR